MSWPGWNALAEGEHAYAASSFAAAWWGGTWLDVYYVSSYDRLVCVSRGPDALWSAPADLGYEIPSGAVPAATWSAGWEDLFFTDSYGRLRHVWFDPGSNWFEPAEPEVIAENLGDHSGVGAAAWGDGYVDLYYSKWDGTLVRKSLDCGSYQWFEEEALAVVSPALEAAKRANAGQWAPAVVFDGAVEHIFWREADGHIMHAQWPFFDDASQTWVWSGMGSPEDIGGEVDADGDTNGVHLSAAMVNGQIHLFWTGLQQDLMHRVGVYGADEFWDQTSGQASLFGSPTVVVNPTPWGTQVDIFAGSARSDWWRAMTTSANF